MSRARPHVPEVGVVDMNGPEKQLIGADGTVYHEVGFNIWADARLSRKEARVVYLGTSRHGGGVTLRPLFFKEGGVWYNFTTGRKAPMGDPFAQAFFHNKMPYPGPHEENNSHDFERNIGES